MDAITPKSISIHAPREGCDKPILPVCAVSSISIHAPREGCDIDIDCVVCPKCDFNPRTPRGVRQNNIRYYKNPLTYFNPRTPRGVRPYRDMQQDPTAGFQSTHPARGATANFTKEQRVCLAQFAYLHKGKKAEHTKTNAPMLHEAFLYAFWVRTGRRRRVLLDFARYKIKGSSGR